MPETSYIGNNIPAVKIGQYIHGSGEIVNVYFISTVTDNPNRVVATDRFSGYFGVFGSDIEFSDWENPLHAAIVHCVNNLPTFTRENNGIGNLHPNHKLDPLKPFQIFNDRALLDVQKNGYTLESNPF